jgi:actin-like ATPase involved in cell morphogenesis
MGFFMFLLNGLEKIIEKEVKVKSKVKQDPLLLTVAKEVGKNPIIKKEINHLMMNFLEKGIQILV